MYIYIYIIHTHIYIYMYLGHDMLMTDLPTPSFCKRFKHGLGYGDEPPMDTAAFCGDRMEYNGMNKTHKLHYVLGLCGNH